MILKGWWHKGRACTADDYLYEARKHYFFSSYLLYLYYMYFSIYCTSANSMVEMIDSILRDLEMQGYFNVG